MTVCRHGDLIRHGYLYNPSKSVCFLVHAHWARLEQMCDCWYPAALWPFLEVYSEDLTGVLRTIDRRVA